MLKRPPHLADIILQQGKTFSLCLTGGGTDVIPAILRRGGMSKIFLGLEVPYSTESLLEIADYPYVNEKAVSQFTSHSMARYVLQKYTSEFSVGVSASLYCENQRKGRVNQAYLSIENKDVSIAPYHNHIDFLDTQDRLYQEYTLTAFIMTNMVFYLVGKMPELYYWNHITPLSWVDSGVALFKNVSISNQDFVKAIS